jgi:O-6-methylguanine DNA methyltransferase
MKLEIETKDGTFVAYYSTIGLAQLNFPDDQRPGKETDDAPASAQVRTWHSLTTKALKAMLAGKKITSLPPLDLTSGTDFQRQVWNGMRKINLGRTKSYSELAAAIAKPKAVRAVGGACGANPIPVLIPCHRVLAANQKLGGFSSGLPWKRKLLAREGAPLSLTSD